MKNIPDKTTHIVTLHGEPVTGLTEDRSGKANVLTGKREHAIGYTKEEADGVVDWIGIGAEAELK